MLMLSFKRLKSHSQNRKCRRRVKTLWLPNSNSKRRKKSRSLLTKFKFKRKRTIGVKSRKERTKKRSRRTVLTLNHLNALRSLLMSNLFRRLSRSKSFLNLQGVRNTNLHSVRCLCQDQCLPSWICHSPKASILFYLSSNSLISPRLARFKHRHKSSSHSCSQKVP